MKGIPCKGDPVLLALKLEMARWQEMGVAARVGGTPLLYLQGTKFWNNLNELQMRHFDCSLVRP